MQEKFIEMKNLIDKAENILLATHENPDGDGLSSMLALSLYLDSIEKKHFLYVPDKLPKHLSYLPRFKSLSNEKPKEKFDLLIGLDYGKIDRLGLAGLDLSGCKIISVDHHPNDFKGDLDIIDAEYSATAEMIYDFFSINRIPLSKDIGTCIYTGILSDTGGFSNSNTTSKVFKIAAELLLLGIDSSFISKQILGIGSENAVKLTGVALMRVTVDEATQSAYSFLSWTDLKQYNVEWDEMDDISHIIRAISGIKFVFFLRDKEDGDVKVSFRSDPYKGYDVSKLAQEFGGGGHIYASGAKIHDSLDNTIQRILKVAKEKDFSIK